MQTPIRMEEAKYICGHRNALTNVRASAKDHPLTQAVLTYSFLVEYR